MEINNLVFEVKDAPKLGEGQHGGEISRVEIRDTPQGYKYCDIFFKLNDDVEVKCGFPAHITPNSSLGIFVKKFMSVEPGGKVDLTKLVGKKVSLETYNEKTDEGEFARVVKESIKVV